MVFCAIVGCGNSSKAGSGAFCRIPKIREHEGPEERARSEERRRLWLKAIARDDLTEAKLNAERICWKHFVNGIIYDCTNGLIYVLSVFILRN